MKNYFAEIQSKLNKELELEDIEIVDNSHKHKGHKFYRPEKFHLHLKIKSLYFLFINSINSNKIGVKTSISDLRLPAKIEISALFFSKI